jgi:hypothetical protein
MKGHTPPPVAASDYQEFFDETIPDGWFVGPVDVTFDDVEVMVVGTLPVPGDQLADADACDELVGDFREHTRDERIRIAARAEEQWLRKVSWAVRCGDATMVFTHLSVPAMTRLRIKERAVLDTLVGAGVARSRSDALAWCVRLVGRNADEWLEELREALETVEEVRRRGPRS